MIEITYKLETNRDLYVESRDDEVYVPYLLERIEAELYRYTSDMYGDRVTLKVERVPEETFGRQDRVNTTTEGESAEGYFIAGDLRAFVRDNWAHWLEQAIDDKRVGEILDAITQISEQFQLPYTPTAWDQPQHVASIIDAMKGYGGYEVCRVSTIPRGDDEPAVIFFIENEDPMGIRHDDTVYLAEPGEDAWKVAASVLLALASQDLAGREGYGIIGEEEPIDVSDLDDEENLPFGSAFWGR